MRVDVPSTRNLVDYEVLFMLALMRGQGGPPLTRQEQRTADQLRHHFVEAMKNLFIRARLSLNLAWLASFWSNWIAPCCWCMKRGASGTNAARPRTMHRTARGSRPGFHCEMAFYSKKASPKRPPASIAESPPKSCTVSTVSSPALKVAAPSSTRRMST